MKHFDLFVGSSFLSTIFVRNFCSTTSVNSSEIINRISKSLKLESIEDWESLTKTQITSRKGGKKLLSKHSLYEIKCLGCPEGEKEFKKPNKPIGYWDDEDNIKKYLLELKNNLNIKNINELTYNKIYFNGGSRLLNKYSMKQIKNLFPFENKLNINENHQISIKKPIGYWNNDENIKKFILELKEKLNLNTFNDWNQLTIKQIKTYGGSTLVAKYSLDQIKSFGFPDGKNQFEKRIQYKSKGYWDIKENILNFLFELEEKLNLKTQNDWNLLSRKQIIQFGGSRLLSKYTIYEIKCLGCPEGKILFGQPQKSKKFWHKNENIQNFIIELKNKLNLNTYEDWNSITQKDILKHGGRRLLSNLSIFEIKCLGFPDGKDYFDNPYKTSNFWDKKENIQLFIDFLKEKLDLKTLDDWKRISKDQIRFLGGNGLLSKFSSGKMNQFASEIPELEKIKFISTKSIGKSSQRFLFLQIQKLFPNEEIIEDYFHSDISRETGAFIQFDVFLVKRNIGFEYHGIHHYEDIPQRFSSLEMYKFRDSEKQKLCKQFGVHLIVIPYWWDNKIASLKQTIHESLGNS